MTTLSTTNRQTKIKFKIKSKVIFISIIPIYIDSIYIDFLSHPIDRTPSPIPPTTKPTYFLLLLGSALFLAEAM
jgi:hypothetical protein